MGAVTPEIIREILDYNPTTGALTWRTRPEYLFAGPKYAANWNARYAGRVAFTAVSNGYRTGRIFNKSYQAQRVAWAHHYGKWPSHDIDHINGLRDDNRIANLRDVPNAENHKNMRMRQDNSSGVTGVTWNKETKKWNARIRVNGKNLYLGAFRDINDARLARLTAEVANGYHKNHGKEAA